MGTIYKRGCVFWIKYYRGGRPLFESARTDKETEARRLLRIREGQVAEGRHPGLRIERVRLEEIAKDFLDDYKAQGRKDLRHAEKYAAALKDHFGARTRAMDITTPKVKAFAAQKRTEGMAPATINRHLSALKRMFSLAVKQTPPKVLRVPHIPHLEENNIRAGFFAHDEFLSLRGALPDHLRIVVTLAYYTGFRRGEILSLRWEQVDLDGRRIALNAGETKNKEARTVYMTDDLHRHLDAWKKHRDGVAPNFPLVCFRMGGNNRKGTKKPAPVGDFKKTWAAACEAVGLGGRLLHDFRRTAVRNMVRAGVSEAVAMKISGHKTRSIFDRYNVTSEQDLMDAATKLDLASRLQNGYNLISAVKEREDEGL